MFFKLIKVLFLVSELYNCLNDSVNILTKLVVNVYMVCVLGNDLSSLEGRLLYWHSYLGAFVKLEKRLSGPSCLSLRPHGTTAANVDDNLCTLTVISRSLLRTKKFMRRKLWRISKHIFLFNKLVSPKVVSFVSYVGKCCTGLFISPSGISELDGATTKTDTAERSISIGRESLQFFFCTRGLGVLPGSTARG